MGCVASSAETTMEALSTIAMSGSPGSNSSGTTREARLFHAIGGHPQVLRMTTLFYESVFKDPHLSKFVMDTTEPHPKRFALWLEQQMTGAPVWNAERAERAMCPVHKTVGSGHNTFVHVVHDRTSAHVAAWYSPKRPPAEQGRRFKLYDTRLWMRLHFWAAREAGLLAVPAFAEYYADFIGEFAGVYEFTAPPFAREDMEWSASRDRIDAYVAAGRRMSDLEPIKPTR